MKRILAAAILIGLAAPLAAQPTPDGPAPDPRVERQRNNAAKLAGLVAFVDASCPGAKGDADRLRSAVSRLGVDPDELSRGDLNLRARAYTEIYQKDVEANCRRALDTFGEAGTAIPGLVVRK
ncbi:hypothetical protein [Methylobacterium nigriterrae]|uniref:hypothetical protein n=1 Tax=Methylobacterium nigriterrae TaxID=3127512 RepID=UPI003013A27C